MLWNLARMTVAVGGIGTLTLGVAVQGLLTFDLAGVPTGQVVRYAISDGPNSEAGRGTYTASGLTLSRDVIYNSTNGGAAINVTTAAQVFITALREDFAGPKAATHALAGGL